MSYQSSITPLSFTVGALFLVSAAGVHPVFAADQDVDAQTQAAHLLQHPQTWINQTGGVNLAESVSNKALDAQEQARRVLQPNIDLSGAGTTVVATILASDSVDPQLQAARVLSHNFY